MKIGLPVQKLKVREKIQRRHGMMFIREGKQAENNVGEICMIIFL
jgi:hypothetical protein